VWVRDEDVWKTSFKTKPRFFKQLILPIGLCNAPATFRRVMNEVLRPFLDDFVIVYLDDILICRNDWNDHVMYIHKVFEVLREAKLYLKMSKCEFVRKSSIYLGQIIGGGQVKIDPIKVEVVVQWPTPTNVVEKGIFLALCNIYASLLLFFLLWLHHSMLLQERIMGFSGEENNKMLLICLK